MKHYKINKVNELPRSEVEIDGEIDAEFLSACFEKALDELAKGAELPGFRKGKVPKEVVSQRLGEMKILYEAAQIAFEEQVPKILEEKKIVSLGQPNISITKIAKGSPLGFKIRIAVFPTFKLPDYKKLSQSVKPINAVDEIKNEEIDEVIMEIRKSHAHSEFHKKNPEADHNHPPIEEKDLIALTDESVKQFGDFKNISDLREKIKENLKKEKENRAKDKRRAEIIEKIISETKIEVPEVLIQNELDRMSAQFSDDLARHGMKFENYLKQIEKTEEAVREEWKESAEKKAKTELLIHEIAEKEKIIPETSLVQSDTQKILTMYPDADPVRARSYVSEMYTNKLVMEFLENL